MLRFFKRRSPARRAEPVAAGADVLTAYYWHLTQAQWKSLTDFERAECRRNVTAAPRFTP